jgi:hypothetical protein
MHRYLFHIIFILIGTKNCVSQSFINHSDSDTFLSTYLQNSFFEDFKTDSCYTGIHFIEIAERSDREFSVTVTGTLPEAYLERLIYLTKNFYRQKENIKDSRLLFKKGKIVIQPVFFSIKKGCTYNMDFDISVPEDSLFLNKSVIYFELIKKMTAENISLMNSYKALFNAGAINNCTILKGCFIEKKTVLSKVVM